MQHLVSKLGHKFSDIELLKLALTHRSVRKHNNERLEFLGDSILNFIIASELFERFVGLNEGELTRARASLVCGETLAEIARELNLNRYIMLGGGEQKSGGHNRSSILADGLEAIIGAIYLDSGIVACKICILAWFKAKLADISEENVIKDPKTTLQELLQAKQLPLPEYNLIRTTGEDHKQIFFMSCRVELLPQAVEATGMSRREAERNSAVLILKKLDER